MGGWLGWRVGGWLGRVGLLACGEGGWGGWGGWLVGWSVGWGGWLVGLSVGVVCLFVGWLVGWWVAGWLGGWLGRVGLLACGEGGWGGWLVGWLAGWLVGWLVGCWRAVRVVGVVGGLAGAWVGGLGWVGLGWVGLGWVGVEWGGRRWGHRYSHATASAPTMLQPVHQPPHREHEMALRSVVCSTTSGTRGSGATMRPHRLMRRRSRNPSKEIESDHVKKLDT